MGFLCCSQWRRPWPLLGQHQRLLKSRLKPRLRRLKQPKKPLKRPRKRLARCATWPKQIDAEIDGNDASEDAEDKDDDDARWTFQLGINGLANYGNANSINAALTAGALGLWGPWKLEIKGVAGYGESGTPTQATQVNSLNGTLTVARRQSP